MSYDALGALFINIMSFGAKPDGETLCSAAIQFAVETCVSKGGGTVFVPSGTFLTGPIELKSNIRLYLDAGARLVFSTDKLLYPVIESRWEGSENFVYMPMIYGRGINHVSIEGNGIIDGQGAFWWEGFRNKTLDYPRPRLISLEESESILIENVTCVNSPAWTINPIRSSNITINNVKIRNPADSPNTDGINPDSCRNVRISNCHVDVGDDCITLKSGIEKSRYRIACENIIISNCTLVHGHGGVVIGSEMSGGVKNVIISNCIFQGTDRGIRIKTRRGRGGVVEDIHVSTVIMKDVLCPIVIHCFYFCGEGGKEKVVADKNPHPVTLATPVIRNIHFSNLTAKNAHSSAAFLYGLPEAPISQISFQNVFISMAENAEPQIPAMMEGIDPMAKRGIFCCNVEGISFERVSVTNHEGPKYCLNAVKDVDFFGEPSGSL